MAEYIEREALLKQLEIAFDKEGKKVDECVERNLPDCSVKYGHGQYCYLVAKTMVQDEPPADVVEVVHGKWVTKERHEHYPSGKPYEADYCSVCNKRGSLEYDYCPNCGAKMDGKGDAE